MEIKIPEVGESVREALLAKWFKKPGDVVKKDEPLCEIETDKITLDLNADATGVLSVLVLEGATVAVGTVIGSIDEQGSLAETPVNESTQLLAEKLAAPPSSPTARREMREHEIAPDEVKGTGKGGRITLDDLFLRIEEKSRQPPPSRPVAPVEPTVAAPPKKTVSPLSVPPIVVTKPVVPVTEPPKPLTPAEPEVVLKPVVTPEPLLPPEPVAVLKPAISPEPVVSAVIPELLQKRTEKSEAAPVLAAPREERRKMSPIRKSIAERMLAARQQTAMLTTFNEADLSRVKSLRSTHREHCIKKHGYELGFMPFFIKACVEALKEYPNVNASIDGDDIVYHHFYDIGVAMGGEKGLVVPVLRSVDSMKLHEIEMGIALFSGKIKTNQLTIADLTGGTFTISNGGVYGSMLSTPILNPPQSAVLGMHAIQERPVVRDGEIVIRPMMYLALSYDHRIIDGREAVGFLKKVKEYIEDPEELLLEG